MLHQEQVDAVAVDQRPQAAGPLVVVGVNQVARPPLDLAVVVEVVGERVLAGDEDSAATHRRDRVGLSFFAHELGVFLILPLGAQVAARLWHKGTAPRVGPPATALGLALGALGLQRSSRDRGASQLPDGSRILRIELP